MLTFRQYLQEGNPLVRVLHHAATGRHFVGISAQRSDLSKPENEKRHKELKDKVLKQGYGFRETEGHWEGGKEKSLLVHAKGVGNSHGASLHRDMVAHAKHYGQDSIIHHTGKTGVYRGTNKTGYPGLNKTATVGHTIKVNPPHTPNQTTLRGKKHAQASFAIEEVMKQIGTEEYESRQKTFLKESGPNTGNGFYGFMAWEAVHKHKFRDLLRSEGYDIPPEEDVSDMAIFGEEIEPSVGDTL